MSSESSELSDLQAWQEFLDDLERGLGLTGVLNANREEATSVPWMAPDWLPGLPSALEERVREILVRQTVTMERLEAARLEVRRHLQYLEVDATKGLIGGPRFIDQRT